MTEWTIAMGIFKGAAAIGAGLVVGLAAVGPGAGQGQVARDACKAIGQAPGYANTITRNMLIGQAATQTTSIFGLVVALLMIFAL